MAMILVHGKPLQVVRFVELIRERYGLVADVSVDDDSRQFLKLYFRAPKRTEDSKYHAIFTLELRVSGDAVYVHGNGSIGIPLRAALKECDIL